MKSYLNILTLLCLLLSTVSCSEEDPTDPDPPKKTDPPSSPNTSNEPDQPNQPTQPDRPNQPTQPDQPSTPSSTSAPSSDDLISIEQLEQLYAIRYDLDGDGTVDEGVSVEGNSAYNTAFGNTASCVSGSCKGYQLSRSLDFSSSRWATGSGWTPIDRNDPSTSTENPYNALFNGNNHTISNLLINNRAGAEAGLFGVLGEEALIYNLRLEDVRITGHAENEFVGSLAARSKGSIRGCSATGQVSAVKENSEIGGLVGENSGTFNGPSGHISASYSEVNVTGTEGIGSWRARRP